MTTMDTPTAPPPTTDGGDGQPAAVAPVVVPFTDEHARQLADLHGWVAELAELLPKLRAFAELAEQLGQGGGLGGLLGALTKR